LADLLQLRDCGAPLRSEQAKAENLLGKGEMEAWYLTGRRPGRASHGQPEPARRAEAVPGG
jgi:hypothetical protein